MKPILIKNVTVVNEQKQFKASVLIANGIITEIYPFNSLPNDVVDICYVIDGKYKYLIPGVIDSHVHFREPGLTYKEDIYSGSKAAVAGGVTSFMDMPNTIPPATTIELLEQKFEIAAQKSLANYSFYLGASNNNIDEILNANPNNICGLKLFLSSSTGNMLVNQPESLKEIFSSSPLPIAVHSEDESIIQENLRAMKIKYGDNIPIHAHSQIRSAEACYKATIEAIELAKQYNTRLHILHVSTADETVLFDNELPCNQKLITSEVCVPHIVFNNSHYDKLGAKIKCNPSIKTNNDNQYLLNAIINNYIDIISSDHAPHLIEEKKAIYTKTPSGMPFVQHTLITMLELYLNNKITLETIVEKMCHNPALIFNIENRGFIRKNYYADLVLFEIRKSKKWKVSKDNILYKCNWSPLEGNSFRAYITHTFVNGNLVYDNGTFNETYQGQRLYFNR